MKNLKVSNKKGFSLVELLVVIAVIGVIAAIAIPAMSGIFGKADATKTNRNAQAIVSQYNAARAAGNTATHADKAAAVAAITGAAPMSGSGVFSTSQFSAPMSTTERDAADDQIITVGTGVSMTLALDPTLAVVVP